MAVATPISPVADYAKQAPSFAANLLRNAANPVSDVGSSIAGPGDPYAETSTLTGLMALGHALNSVPAGSYRTLQLNIHPKNGTTVTTRPVTGGTAPTPGAKTAAKPKPKTPNIGNEISNGNLIDAYNQEAAGIPAQVQSIYTPIANSLANLFANRSNVLQNAINSYTPIYGQLLGQYGPESQAAYNSAEQSQAAVDAMLQSALGGQGAASSAALAKEIGTTGVAAPVANAMEGLNASRYQGEQGAAAGRGAASLSQLLGEQANAVNYGAQLPGIAGAAGLLATRQGQSQITNDELSAINSLMGNEGQTSGQLYSDLRQALNNMGMLEMYYGPRGIYYQNAGQADLTKAGAAQTTANAAKTRANAYAGPYANAATTKAGAAATNAGANVTRAKAYATKATSGTPPSASVTEKFWNNAYYGVPQKYYQGQPVAGTGVPPLTYGAAIARAVAMGQPRQDAIRQANSMYKPGEGGRPALTSGQNKAVNLVAPNLFGNLTNFGK